MKLNGIRRLHLYGLSLIGASLASSFSVAAQSDTGRALLEEHCAMCHALGSRDSSLQPAPPLRRLIARYDLDELAERLISGTLLPAIPRCLPSSFREAKLARLEIICDRYKNSLRYIEGA